MKTTSVPAARIDFTMPTPNVLRYMSPNRWTSVADNNGDNITGSKRTHANGFSHLRLSLDTVAKSATKRITKAATSIASGIIYRKSL